VSQPVTTRSTVRPATAHEVHRHSRNPVQVEALHRSVPPALVAAPHAPRASATTPAPHLPQSGKRVALAIALAVLALSVAARRWILVAHAPATRPLT
jgi:hypothetical protein